MQRALTLHQTTVGKKVIVAVTGVVLVGFVVGHMAGNLQIYLGPEKLNAYAEFLHSNPGLLWTARAVLLASVIAHIVYSMQLASLSGDARPRAYARRVNNATNLAAISMRLSGPTLALFIVYHLLHLTFGKSPVPHSPTDVYANVVGSFSVWWLAAIYVVAQLLLGLHLFHGAWSFFQTLGLNHPRYNALRRRFAAGLTALVVLGNISIPVAVQAGWVRPADEFERGDADEAVEARLEVR
jgi:succinate dehydrogenase / fumarate reductase cytochrome b subunit